MKTFDNIFTTSSWHDSFVYNVDRYPIFHREPINSSFIFNGFHWGHTQEGSIYWSIIDRIWIVLHSKRVCNENL